MGSGPIPTYANIFMAKIDEVILQLAGDNLMFLKRFLDDIICVWKGKIEELYIFMDKLNTIHPSIKFTFNHTAPQECKIQEPHDCWCHTSRAVPFLDTNIWLENGKFYTDLYRKPTDRCQYLLPNSCHPSYIKDNIPYSLTYESSEFALL